MNYIILEVSFEVFLKTLTQRFYLRLQNCVNQNGFELNAHERSLLILHQRHLVSINLLYEFKKGEPLIFLAALVFSSLFSVQAFITTDCFCFQLFTDGFVQRAFQMKAVKLLLLVSS